MVWSPMPPVMVSPRAPPMMMLLPSPPPVILSEPPTFAFVVKMSLESGLFRLTSPASPRMMLFPKSAEMMSPYIPAGIDVEMIAAHSQPLLSTQRDRKIVDRLGDIARLVAFLASDASASCTGSDFLIDGGNLAGTLIPGTPGS